MKYTQTITTSTPSFKTTIAGVDISAPSFVNSTLNTRVQYKCEDYIEVPGGTETIITTDEDGQSYEISVPDLISADDDNEIQITKAKRKITPMVMAAFTRQRAYC